MDEYIIYQGTIQDTYVSGNDIISNDSDFSFYTSIEPYQSEIDRIVLGLSTLENYFNILLGSLFLVFIFKFSRSLILKFRKGGLKKHE